MTNDGVLELVRRCNLNEGIELIPGEVYLFNKRFLHCTSNRKYYQLEEIIVLVKNGKKVGGIYRMGKYDVHWVINERYRNQHILSNFLKTGILNEVWPENTSVELHGIYTQAEYNEKKYLAELCGFTIRNKEEIEKHLSNYGWKNK